MNEYRKHKYIYTYTHNGILFMHRKKYFAICNQIDETGWNKPNTERYILHDLMYVESKIVKLIRQKGYTGSCQELGGRKNEMMLVKPSKLSIILDD